MKTYTVAEVLELDEKTPITSIKGTLTKVWPAKTFKFKKGPRRGEEGSVQNLTLEDETGTIDIKNWGEPLPKSDRGETFIFESHKGKKGWVGLVTEIDNYDEDNPKTIISMNENAKIKNPDGTNASPASQKAKAGGNEAPPTRDPYELIAEAKEGLRLSVRAALELRKELHQEFGDVTGEDISGDTVTQWAASINYYLRDKGAYAALRPVKTSTPGESRDLNPKEEKKVEKPKMTNDEEDEIPF